MNTKQIKKRLIDKDLSITDLASRVGVSRVFLSLLIHGHRKSKPTWQKIADILDIELKKTV